MGQLEAALASGFGIALPVLSVILQSADSPTSVRGLDGLDGLE